MDINGQYNNCSLEQVKSYKQLILYITTSICATENTLCISEISFFHVIRNIIAVAMKSK